MNLVTQTDLSEAVSAFMRDRITMVAADVAEKHKKAALADLDEAVRKAVTDTAVHFSKMISVKDCGEQIVITISDRRGEKKP